MPEDIRKIESTGLDRDYVKAHRDHSRKPKPNRKSAETPPEDKSKASVDSARIVDEETSLLDIRV